MYTTSLSSSRDPPPDCPSKALPASQRKPHPAMSMESYLAKCPNQIGQFFDISGMSGWVCATPARPGTLDITNCCPGQYRVQGNCIQICESRPELEFGSCVNSGVGADTRFCSLLCRLSRSAWLLTSPVVARGQLRLCSRGDGGRYRRR